MLVPNFRLLTLGAKLSYNLTFLTTMVIFQNTKILSATPSLCMWCLLNVPSLYKSLTTKVLLSVINQLKNTLYNIHLGLKPTRQQTIHIYQVPHWQQCSAVYEQLHRRRIAFSVYPMYKTYKTTSLMLTYFLLPLLFHLSIQNFLVQIFKYLPAGDARHDGVKV